MSSQAEYDEGVPMTSAMEGRVNEGLPIQNGDHNQNRQWDGPEYPYRKKRKQLFFSVFANIAMMLLVIILAVVFSVKKNEASSSKSSSSSSNSVPTIAPAPTVPRPTFQPVRERPQNYDESHPQRPPQMNLAMPSTYFEDDFGEFGPPPPPPPPVGLPPVAVTTPTNPPVTPPTHPQSTVVVTLPPQPTEVDNVVPPQTTDPPFSYVEATPSPTQVIPPHVATPQAHAEESYVIAFEQMQDRVKWPLEGGRIDATFGPQIRDDCDCYEFHRGIDLISQPGANIYAIYDGIVVDILTEQSKGVVIEHTFSEDVLFHKDKDDATRWYSLYFHSADWQVSKGDAVLAGQTLAKLKDDHLHQEVRLGTACDLQDTISNPSQSCNTFGWDPHVHPIMLYPKANLISTVEGIPALDISLAQEFSQNLDAIISFSTPATNPNLNKYTVAVINVATGYTRVSQTLDLNLREGFDATSLEKLDTPDKTKPYLDPKPNQLDGNNLTWTTNMVIPKAWVTPKSTEEEIVITAEDVWGKFKFLAFGLGEDISERL